MGVWVQVIYYIYIPAVHILRKRQHVRPQTVTSDVRSNSVLKDNLTISSLIRIIVVSDH